MPEYGISLKQGRGYEAPWITIKGDDIEQVRQATAQVAGLDAGDLPLTEVVYNVSEHFHKVGSVGSALGASVIGSQPTAQEPAQEAAAAPQPAEEEAPAPEANLEQLVADTESVSALGDLYLTNKAAFDADSEAMDKLKAKVTKLKG